MLLRRLFVCVLGVAALAPVASFAGGCGRAVEPANRTDRQVRRDLREAREPAVLRGRVPPRLRVHPRPHPREGGRQRHRLRRARVAPLHRRRLGRLRREDRRPRRRRTARSASARRRGMMLRIQDDMKRDLTFGVAPKRIVSLVPSDTYSVAALGCGDRARRPHRLLRAAERRRREAAERRRHQESEGRRDRASSRPISSSPTRKRTRRATSRRSRHAA